jgi:transposase
MSQFNVSLFKLQGFRVNDVLISESEITLKVKRRRKTAVCPKCQKRTKRLKDYHAPSRILHMVLCNQKVYLELKKRRFTCTLCHTVFTERLPFVAPRARRSIYVQNHAMERLADSSFKAVGRQLGFAYSSLTGILRKIFNIDTICWQDQIVGGKLRLGIDEHHFRRNQFVVTIANLLSGKPVHILPDDRQATLVSFLASLPDKVKGIIDEVAVDMKMAFVRAVEKQLPKIRIVIDHFHVIQDANRRVNEARKIEDDVQEKIRGNGPRRINWRVLVTAKEHLKPNQEQLLAKYLSWYPAVSTFYACKESLRDMYKSANKDIARRRLEKLIYQMKSSEYPDLWIWARTLSTYKEYILNYFDNHTTNAVTEGLHRKFKLIQRTAYGFRNPEVYVRRIMLACLPLVFLKLPH